MGSRRCCCDCWSFVEAFDRANSTTIGNGWTEESGDWSIVSQKLQEAGTVDALIVNSTTHPRDVLLKANVDGMATGDAIRFILCYDNANDYLWGQVEKFATNYTISVGEVTGGVESPLDSWTSTSTLAVEFEVCFEYAGTKNTGSGYEGNLFLGVSASGGGASTGVWGCASDTGGRRFGVLNANGTAIDIDWIEVWEHYTHRLNADCPYCACHCNEGCTPHDLIATFSATGKCTTHGLDGLTIALSRVEGQGYSPKWYGIELDVCDCAWCSNHNWDMLLECVIGTSGVAGWKVSKHNASGGTGTDECTYTTPAWDASPAGGWSKADYPAESPAPTCDPFMLVFGPYTVVPQSPPSGCDCCAENDDEDPQGTYTIVITEAP